MNIAIIDCGMGNLRSLFKAFYFPASSLHPTVNAKFVRSVQEIRQADTEQGSFLHCIKSLNNNGLQKVLQEVFLKRTSLIIEKSVIKKVFYPIFPPDKHVNQIIKWLKIK